MNKGFDKRLTIFQDPGDFENQEINLVVSRQCFIIFRNAFKLISILYHFLIIAFIFQVLFKLNDHGSEKNQWVKKQEIRNLYFSIKDLEKLLIFCRILYS
jgi:hypothetical protein